MNKLSEEQVKQRLIEGRNYKRLYFELKDRFDEVASEHKKCPDLVAELESRLETQAAQIEELQVMVFDIKPKSGLKAKVKTVVNKQVRSNDSYRRPLPPASAITHYKHHPTTNCHRCGHELTDKAEA